jgi:hypothetical protein
MRHRHCMLRSLKDRSRFLAGIAAVMILLPVSVECATCQILWEKRYGGDYDEQARAVIQPAGELSYVVVGSTDSYGPGTPASPNPFIMKVDYRGQLVWFRTHGTDLAEGVYCVKQTPSDRGFVMCGYRRLAPNHEAMLVIKVDPAGNLIWDRTYGGDYSGFAYTVTPTHDGGYLLSGFLGEDFPAYAKGCLLKLNGEGTVLWKRLFTWTLEGTGCRAIESGDGDIVFAGYADLGEGAQEQFFVTWTDPTGLPYRTRYYGGPNPDRLIAFETTASGYILVGNTADDPPVHAWPYVVAISRTGEIQWERVLAASYSQTVRGIDVTDDGGIIISGETNQAGVQMWDLMLLKVDATGNVIWCRRHGAGGLYTDIGYSVLQCRDGGYLSAGLSASGGPGTSIYLVKTGPDGRQDAFGPGDQVPTHVSPQLLATPNPFRAVTSIAGHESQPVVLYDIGGRLLGHYEGGRIGADLPPGVYFLKPNGADAPPVRIVKVP